MKFNTLFSKDVFHAREKSGLTQAEVAEKVDISLRNYQYTEQGRFIPRGGTLLKLIYLFDLDIDRYREVLGMPKSE